MTPGHVPSGLPLWKKFFYRAVCAVKWTVRRCGEYRWYRECDEVDARGVCRRLGIGIWRILNIYQNSRISTNVKIPRKITKTKFALKSLLLHLQLSSFTRNKTNVMARNSPRPLGLSPEDACAPQRPSGTNVVRRNPIHPSSVPCHRYRSSFLFLHTPRGIPTLSRDHGNGDVFWAGAVCVRANVLDVARLSTKPYSQADQKRVENSDVPWIEYGIHQLGGESAAGSYNQTMWCTIAQSSSTATKNSHV